MGTLDDLLQKYQKEETRTPRPGDPPSPATKKDTAPKPRPAARKPAPQQEPEPQKPAAEQYEVEYITGNEKAQYAVSKLLEDMDSQGIYGIDIETEKVGSYKSNPQAGLEPHLSKIRLIQICRDPSRVYVFDLRSVEIQAVKPLFDYTMVAHNAVFEMKHLYHAGITAKPMECTLLMYNALFGKTLSLQKLAWKYLEEDVPKDEQTSDWGAEKLTDEQINYAAKDAALALSIYEELNTRLQDSPSQRFYDLLRDVQYPVMKMEYTGCNFDLAKHHMMQKEWKAAEEKVEKDLKDFIGTEININSSKQLSDWLKARLDKKDLKGWKGTASGDLSTDNSTLQKYSHLDFIKPLLTYKKLSKLINSFGESFTKHINPVTGRIHPSFRTAGADTGRFTCSKPNLQQFPREKEFRALFHASRGYKVVSADYSQVELRILAMLAEEPTMLKAYENGEDLHKLTASKASGTALEEITDEQRSAAKAVNFGLIFGMGAKSLAEYARNSYGVEMTIRQAKELSSAYFKAYPKISSWHKKVYKYSKGYYCAKTPTGRVVRLPKNKVYTKSKNTPVQGGAAEVMTAALIHLDRELTRQKLDAAVVNIVHDEIVLEVAEDQAEQARDTLEQAMIDGMLEIFPDAETKGLVDASIGDNWGETK